MSALNLRNSSIAAAAATLLIFSTTGCLATRKYTRNQISPVETRVTGVEKKTTDQASAINDLENGLSKTDERAMDAQNKAKAAQDAADAANRNATDAGNRADQARQSADATSNRLGEVVNNLDNYQLVSTQNVLFPVNRYVLTKDAKDQLDQAVAQVQNSKNFVIEIQGFTDRTGSKSANLRLSQERADAVVRYLTADKNIPLRRIHVIGEGIDSAQQHTRAQRKEARRVELKFFALNLGGPASQGSQAMNNGMGSTNNGMGSNDMNGTRSRTMGSNGSYTSGTNNNNSGTYGSGASSNPSYNSGASSTGNANGSNTQPATTPQQ